MTAGPPGAEPLTTVHLLRHGEVFNPDKVLYGRLPGFRLSDAGLAMAAAAANALADTDVAAVVSSPLERARQTAAPVAARHGVEVTVDERLIESDSVFEGQRIGVGDGALGSPAAWRHLRNPFRPSWGEPFRDVARRVLHAVDAARDAAVGRDVVLVSHQLPIYVVRRYVEGRPLWHHPGHRQCGLASVTSLLWAGVGAEARLLSVTYRQPAAGVVAGAVAEQGPPGAV